MTIEVALVISAISLAFGVADDAVTQVAGIIMAGATMIAYIIGEGLVDANRTGTEETKESELLRLCGYERHLPFPITEIVKSL